MNFDDVLAAAKGLSDEDRRRLTRELGGAIPLTTLGSLAQRPPAPHSVAWVKAERGHAVLATDSLPADDSIPEGADAIAGMWSDVSA